jgi:hypothetical protein
MAQQYTPESLRAETDPGFLVDVIIRRNGKLFAVLPQCYWEEATGHTENAFAQGLEVEMEESCNDCDDSLLPGEIDRQD